MPQLPKRPSVTGAPSTHRRPRSRVVAILGGIAALCAVALPASGAAVAGATASASANGVTVSVSTAAPVLSNVAADVTITVTNTTAAPLPTVNALVDLPDGLSLKTAPATCTKNPLGGRSTLVAECSFGSLAPGASASAVVGLLAPAPGVYTVDVDGTYQVSLPNGFEIFNTPVSLGVPVLPGPTDVQVTGSSNNGAPPLGHPFQLTFQVKDNGPQGAYGVTFDDALPSSLALASVSASIGACTVTGSAIHCDIGTLATGQQANVVVTTIPTAAGTVTDTATAGMTGPDTQPANNTVGVTVQPK